MKDWIMTISTVVLVLVTAYYAFITHRILKYQKDTTTLDYRPFLMMKKVTYIHGKNSYTNSNHSFQIVLNLVNVSRVLLKYEMKNIELSLDNKKNDNGIFLNKGTYVYPNQEVLFTCSAIDFNENFPDLIEGRLKYEIIYYASKEKKYRSYRELRITIQPNLDYIEWKSIDELEEEI